MINLNIYLNQADGHALTEENLIQKKLEDAGLVSDEFLYRVFERGTNPIENVDDTTVSEDAEHGIVDILRSEGLRMFTREECFPGIIDRVYADLDNPVIGVYIASQLEESNAHQKFTFKYLNNKQAAVKALVEVHLPS